MQTVNFQCGHCHKLMAVSTDFLGRQVRCPHCQQVVVAPTAPFTEPPPPPPPPAFQPPAIAPLEDLTLRQTSDQEDIFTPPGQSGDDLFGQHEAPRLEVPIEPALSPLFSPPRPEPFLPVPEEPPADVGPTLAFTSPAEPPPSSPPTPFAPEPAAGEANGLGGGLSFGEPPAAAREEPSQAVMEPAVGGPRKQRAARLDWFNPLVFYPLVLYAVLVSGFLGWAIYNNMQLSEALKHQSPFDKLPDEGDTPGVRPAEKKTSVFRYTEQYATAPLPDTLRTRLGEPLQIGELEVKPLSVRRKKVGVYVKGYETPTECNNSSLVLRMQFRNVSRDQAYAPLDNYFDRYWRPGMGMPPLTYLQAGEERFFGGPARWYPHGGKELREWFEGRQDDEPDLLPGQSKEGIVCTDGGSGLTEANPRAALVLLGEKDGKKVGKPYQGPLLWRVRVRRGLIDWKGRLVSATAVVGVEFTDRDIK